MEDTPLDRLVRFYGRDRFGHLYLRAWRYLVDGTGQWLGLPDYLVERILDQALAELDARLDDVRSSIDTRPAVLTFAFGWESTHEQLRHRHGSETDETDDGAFWAAAAAELERDEAGSLIEGFFDALDSLGDPRYRIVLLQDTIAGGPATPSIVAESTGVPQRGTARLRAEARAVLRNLLVGTIPSASRWADREAAPSDTSATEAFARCYRLVLDRCGELPPEDDLEKLGTWLQRFEKSRGEMALSALWKRLPPPEVVERGPEMPQPLVSLAESLFQRLEGFEREMKERLDTIEARLQGEARRDRFDDDIPVRPEVPPSDESAATPGPDFGQEPVPRAPEPSTGQAPEPPPPRADDANAASNATHATTPLAVQPASSDVEPERGPEPAASAKPGPVAESTASAVSGPVAQPAAPAEPAVNAESGTGRTPIARMLADALRPGRKRARTHDQVVERLERYLPAGRRGSGGDEEGDPRNGGVQDATRCEEPPVPDPPESEAEDQGAGESRSVDTRDPADGGARSSGASDRGFRGASSRA